MKKIGVVGAGGAADMLHIPVWNKIPGVKVVGICDIDSNRAEDMALKHKISFACTDLCDLLAKDIDILSVCTPVHTHYPITVQALEAGKHVVTEKPLSADLGEAIEMANLAKKNNLVLAVSQNHIFSTALRRLSTLIKEGYFGDVLLMDMNWWISTYKKNHWTANPKTGGMLVELGVHPAYIASFLFGQGKVTAYGNYPSIEREAGWINVVITNSDKCVCNLRLTPITIQPSIRLFGSKGSAYVNLFADYLYVEHDKTNYGYFEQEMRPVFKMGVIQVTDWIKLAMNVSLAYMKRGIRYLVLKERAFNQYTLFNYVIDAINGNLSEEEFSTDFYLDVAVNSVKILQDVRRELDAK